MSEKMCICKACGQQIAKSAKNCPHCGAKNKKPNVVLIGICIILAFVIIGAAMGGEEEPTRVESTKPTQSQIEGSKPGQDDDKETQSQEKENVFYVGDTVRLNGVNATYVGISESTGSQFNEPAEGNVFVLCEFEIENTSDEEIAVSSMLSFEAYCDDYACNFSLSALLEKGNKNQLDGTIAPGKKMSGVIGYEVSADWKELEVHFTPDFFSGKDIAFIATSN